MKRTIFSLFLFSNFLISQTISVDPDSLYQYLFPGDSAVQTFTIANNGSDTLYYSIAHSSLGCGDNFISNLPFTDTGSNVGMGDDWDVGLSDGDDVAYTFIVSQTVTIDVTVCNDGTDYDTKLEIFTFDGEDCADTYTGAVTTGNYNDDFECTFNGLFSTLQNVTLSAGQYYIVVDGYSGQTGNYELSIVESTGRAIAHDTQADFDLELLKSGLNPDDLFADFQNLQNARNSSTREIQTPNQRSTVTRDSREIMIEIDPDSGMVAPGDSAIISLSMSVPTDDPGGMYNSIIGIYSNDPINSYFSVPITIEVTDIFPPNPVEVLTATPEYGYISLAWDAPEAGLHKYNIYKGISISTITLIDSVVGDPPALNYQDSIVTQEQLYYYQVSAVDQGGNESTLSDIVSILFVLPTISVDSDSMYQYLLPGETATQTFTISNEGNGTLYYYIHVGGDLTGTWSLGFDETCDGGGGGWLEVEFTEDGGLYLFGDLVGQWFSEYGIVDLVVDGDCPAVSFIYNAYLINSDNVYYMFVEGADLNGVYTYGNGVHNGNIYGQMLDDQARIATVSQDDFANILVNDVATIQTPNQRSTVTRDNRDVMIEIDPDSGIVMPGDSVLINVSMSVTTDDPGGMYNSIIGIYSNDPINSYFSVYLMLEVPDILPPNPPDSLTAAPDIGYISLAWDAPEAGLHKYNIYKGISISTITLVDSVVGSPPEIIYQDQNATVNELYYYQVSAVDQGGNESTLSDIVSAMISVNLVINEIMQNPSVVSDANGEWFEIYNKSNVNVPLQNWIIKDDDNEIHTITGGSIPIGSYFVFGNNSNTSANGGVIIDYNYGEDIILSNGSDELILISSDNAIIDSLAWDNGATFPDPNGASMALLDPNLDNSLGSNWAESTLMYGEGDFGTPGFLNYFSDINLDLNALDFDTVDVNDSGILSLTISNQGNIPLQLDSIYTNSTLFTLSFSDSVIDTAALLQITFTPTELGTVTDSLFILSNDPDESMVEVPISGFGYYPAPDIVLESTSLDFGGVMDGLTAMELFRVYNIGDAALEIDTVYCTGNFSVMPSGGTVDATGNLELEVTFSPNDETSFTDIMTIVAGNDPDEDTLTVSLSGTGISPGPDIAVSPEPLDFGLEIVPGDTITKQLVIYNTGLLTLEIEEIDITNSDANASFWTGFEDAVIEPGDSVVIDVLFTTANAIHSASATAIIYNNASNFSFSPIAGYIVKIEDITTEQNVTDTVDIFFNNDLEIYNVFFTISGFGDFSQLSFLYAIGTEWTNNSGQLFEHIHPNNDIQLGILTTGGILETGSGPFARMVIHNNYQTNLMADLHFVSGSYTDAGNVNHSYDSNLLRSGTITIVDAPPPSAPTGLSAEFNDGILLSWNENNEDNFSHYVLDKDTDDSFQTGQYPSITTTETSYLDTVYEDGQVLYYRLSAVNSTGNVSDFSETLSFEVVLSVNEENLIPEVFALHQNYPNPFNPITTLRYDLPEQATVNIIIYDMLGRQVKTLINQTQDVGFKSIIWDATNDFGNPVSAGVYLYKIQAGEFVQTKKMVLLK